MEKDFDQWNRIKKYTNERHVKNLYFREREVWWARLGVNVGFEQDGGGTEYTRPVIILKKYNQQSCLAVPLSTTRKQGMYYFAVGNVEEKQAKAILSQIRMVDVRRLVHHVGTVDRDTFAVLVDELVRVNFKR